MENSMDYRVLDTALETGGSFNIKWKIINKLGLIKGGIFAYYYTKYTQFCKNSSDSWFFLFHDKIIEELGIPENTLISVKKELIELGLMKSKFKGIPRKQYFYIEKERVYNYFYNESTEDTDSPSDTEKVGVNKPRRSVYINREDRGHLNNTININKTKKEKRYLSDFDKSDYDNQNNISSSLVIKRNKPPKINKKQQPIKEETSNLDRPILPSDFELVWERYPKRGDSKKEAKIKWDIACKDKRVEIPNLRDVLKGIRSHSKTKQWKEDNNPPMFTTWINNGRWGVSAERVDEKYSMAKEIERKKQTSNNKRFQGAVRSAQDKIHQKAEYNRKTINM